MVELRKIKIKKQKQGFFKKFSFCKEDVFKRALEELSSPAFKLWCYYAAKKSGETIEEEKELAMKACGLNSKTSYYTSFKELVEKKYLVQTGDCENSYTFNI